MRENERKTGFIGLGKIGLLEKKLMDKRNKGLRFSAEISKIEILIVKHVMRGLLQES